MSLDQIAASALQPFRVVRSRAEFDGWYDPVERVARLTEQWIEDQDEVHGYCACCDAVVPLKVSAGVMFGPHPNLREGLRCPHGLNNRGRLLLHWMGAAAGVRPQDAAPARIALFESHTALARALPDVTAAHVHVSDFVTDDAPSGTTVKSPRGYDVRHEDLTRSSYVDESLDFVVHNDVLEHVDDCDSALRESRRILAPGGVLAFTTPLFIEQDRSVRLARLTAGNRIDQLVEPAEYHGDEARGQILTFHHFGWDLLGRLTAAGFADAAIAVSFNFFEGLTSCNNPYSRNSNVPPLLILALKS